MIQNPIIAQILPAARRALEREVQLGTITFSPRNTIDVALRDRENEQHREWRNRRPVNASRLRWKEAMKRRAEWFAANPGATQRDWQRVYRKLWNREMREKKAGVR